MFTSRRGRIACLFALVLLTELALLCCASTCLSTHSCPGCHRCALCACVRSGLNRAAVAPILALALVAFIRATSGHMLRRGAFRLASLLDRKARFND